MKEYFWLYLISISPIFEPRYAIVYAFLIHLNPVISLIVCVLGALTISILLPFLLINFEKKVIKQLENVKIFSKIIRLYLKYLESVRNRSKKTIEKYGYIGLSLFVFVPLPLTGMWSGCLVAYIFGMEYKKTVISVFIGATLSLILIFIFLLLGYNLFM